MQERADRMRIENHRFMAIDSGMAGSSDRFPLRQNSEEELPVGHLSARSEELARSNRLDMKLKRELGEPVLTLLGDERPKDIVLNPDSSLIRWAEGGGAHVRHVVSHLS